MIGLGVNQTESDVAPGGGWENMGNIVMSHES